jgi:hypothetical protein
VKGIATRADPAVLAIDVGGEGHCTGSLIAPNVVLTARRCVSRTAPEVKCPSTEAHLQGERDARSLRFYLGDDLESARLVATGASVVVPPQQTLCEADLALVVLDQDVEGVEPIDIAAGGVAAGEHVRAVGFGKDVADSAPAVTLTKLQREHVEVLQASESEFVVGESACDGGSGGPALDEQTGDVLGVVARVGASCEGGGAQNVYTRIDAFREIIDQTLAAAAARRPAHAPHAARHPAARSSKRAGAEAGGSKPSKRKRPHSELGAVCTKAGDCATGVCATEGTRRFCSRRCSATDKCPTAYKCQPSSAGRGTSSRREEVCTPD